MANNTTGDGSYSPNITAGYGGDGTVNLDNGTYSVDYIRSGYYTNGNDSLGSITVTGDGTDVDVSDTGLYAYSRITVGLGFDSYRGNGSLSILDNATITSTNNAGVASGNTPLGGYSNLLIGVGGAFADGTVTVAGATTGRSSLILNGGSAGFIVGQDSGTGALTIDDGAYFRTLTGVIGAGSLSGQTPGGEGTVTVSGAGSEFKASTLSGDFLVNTEQAPVVYVGQNGGTGTLNVNTGGFFSVQNEIGDGKSSPTLVFGDDNGSSGLGSVQDAGSELRITQYGPVGSDPLLTRLNGESGIVVGNAGYGRLLVSNDGLVQVLGDRAQLEVSRGSYNVFGLPVPPTDATGVQLTGATGVQLEASLIIASGADFVVDTQAYATQGATSVRVATYRASDGRIVVNGAGSTLIARSDSDQENDYTTAGIEVGVQGQGDLDVTNAGYVGARSLTIGALGYTLNGDGTTNATFSDYNELAAGGGLGTVSVSSGGQIVVTGTENSPNRGITLGQASGSVGTLNIDGATSYVKSTGGAGLVNVGLQGDGFVNVTNGGALYSNIIVVGYGPTSSSDLVTVSDAGSRVFVSGAYGDILSGGLSTGQGPFVEVGRNDGSSAEFRVNNGGVLQITNTANVDMGPQLVLASGEGSYGRVTVNDLGSAINVVQNGARFMAPSGDVFGGSEITVGRSGQGLLFALDSAQVNILGDSATLLVGDGGYDAMGDPIVSTLESRFGVYGGADVSVNSLSYGYDSTAGDYNTGAYAAVGRLVGGYGLITVNGAGSTLSVTSASDFAGDYRTGLLVVGGLGRGALDVEAGGVVDARSLTVGGRSFYDDGMGGGRVYGGYLANVTAAGSGDVSITNGGQVTLTGSSGTPYAGVRIAEASGGVGSVTVSGAGSILTSQGGAGRIRVANYGGGDLTVNNGGLVRGFFVDVGRNEGSNGNVVVDGYGSSILASNAYGNFSADPEFVGQAGFLRLGREDGSAGYLSITNGGRVDVINDPTTNYDNPFVQIGRNNGSYGKLTVDGGYSNTSFDSGANYAFASTLRIAQTGPVGDFVATGGVGPYGPGLAIGQGGQGVAEITNRAQILIEGAAALLVVGNGRRDGNGDPDTTTDTSMLTISSGADVAVTSLSYGGQQTFTDDQGNPVTAHLGAQVIVGGDEGASGSIVLEDSGSTLRVYSADETAGDYQTGRISVGRDGGTGSIIAQSNSLIEARGLEVGVGAGSTGSVTLFGGDATITGTDVTRYQGVVVGRDGGVATLNVRQGSTLTSEGGVGQLQIGREATGQLNINTAGEVNSFFVEVGRGAGSDGGIAIDGYNSRLTVSDAFGSFDPGVVTGPRGGFLRVGRENGGDGYIQVTGGASLNVINDGMVVPPLQADGAILEIGRDFGANGLVVVSGDDGMGNASYIRVQNYGRSNDSYMPGEYYGPELRLGRDGANGQLLVEQGAQARVIGERAQIVIGQGTENGDFAAEPTSLISVTSGGALIADSRPDTDNPLPYNASADIVIGRETGGNGRLLVTGAGSTVNIFSDNATDYYVSNGDLVLGAGLEVGKLGRGVLDVLDGGAVTINGADDAFPHLTVGFGEAGATIDARGYATVSGAGSLIQILGTSTGAGVDYAYGAGGSIDVGTRDGSSGILTVSDGGVVTNSSINSKTQIAQNEGATGEIIVTGAGSTLNAGVLLTIGADIDLATGEFYDFQSGDGTLTIYNQAEVNAVSTYVGSTGTLNINNATLTSDVEVTGDFQIFGTGVGTATVDGAVTATTGTLKFDLFANGMGISADSLTATSAIFSGSAITVEVGAAFLLNVGDSATLFSTQGTLDIDSLETINFIGETANAGQKFSVDLLTLPFGQTTTSQLVFNVQQASLANLGGDGMAIVANGGQVALTTVDLDVSETGVTPENTIFTAANPIGGQLEFATEPGVAITTFTQADVNARAVRFVDDDMVTDGSFDLSYTDTAGFTDTITFSVTEGTLNPLAEFNVGDLDGTNGVTLNGIVAGDQTGLGVSDVGDINGDGISDIAVGASFADTPAGSDSGEGYIIFGVDGGLPSPFELSSLDGTNGFTFSGLGAQQLTAVNGSVEGVGDVNNDGIDDFLVGIGGVDSGGVFNVGEAFLIYGNLSGFGANFDLGNLDGTNGTRIVGIDFNSLTGQLVPGLGDVNGDGIDDIGISATFGDGAAGTDSGESFVVFGADGGLGATLMLSGLDGTNGFRLEGESAGDNSGTIGRIGDFNNDGIDDFLVGTPNDDNANGFNTGNVQIIFGTTAAQSAVRQLGSFTPAEGFRIFGLAANDSLGSSVSDGGDINGDGIDDLIITSKTADVGGVVDAGTTYVIFGTTDDFSGSFDLATLDGTNGFSVSGSATGQRAGYTSASAGDVNGDGIEDLIIGAVGAAPGGEAYVIFGSTGPFAATFDQDSLNGVNGFQISSAGPSEALGRDVSTAGDFNNDGIDDILAGANAADPGGRINAGEAYVIYGVGGAGILAPTIDGDLLVDVVQAQSVVLTTADLTASELNSTPADLLYHVTNLVGGIVSANGAPGVPISTFTQADLEAGLISFEHDGDTPSGVSFDATVTDQEGDIVGPVTVAADVLIPNEAPEVEVAIPNMAVFTDDVNNFFFSPSLGQGSLLFTDFSISFFAEIDQVNVGADYFISYTSPDFTQALGVFASGDNLNLTYNDQFLGTLPATGLSDGEVHHIALTFDQDAESFRIFLDGADIGTLDAMGAGRLRAGGQFVLGEGFDSGMGPVPEEGLIGALGSVRIRSIELDAADVLLESQGILGGATPGLFRDFQVQPGNPEGTVIINDATGNSGAPGNLQISGANELREPIRATEDIAIITPEIIITDVDNSDGNQEVTLSVTNGIVTLQDLTGLTIIAGANGTDTVTFQGATGDIRVALQQVEYLADPDFNGSDILTVDTDDLGNSGIGGPLTDSRDILIGIAAVNDDPVALDDFLSLSQDETLSGSVFSDNGFGADFDVDGDAFQIVEIDGSPTNIGLPFTASGGGQLTISADGTFGFLTNGAYDALSEGAQFDEVFAYTIEDDFGARSTANFALTIGGVNDAPVAQDDSFQTDEDTPVSGDLFTDNGSGVDLDIDMDSFFVTAVDGDNANVGVPIQLGGLGAMLLVRNDGTFDFTPGGGADVLADGQFGAANFTYEITDGAGKLSTADVLITINGLNDAPVAVDDTFTTVQGAAFSGNVLDDNGIMPDLDIDNGDVLTVVAVNGLSQNVGQAVALNGPGSVILNDDGSFDFVNTSDGYIELREGETFLETLTYTIADTLGVQSTATVNITITGINDAPLAFPEDGVFAEDAISGSFDLFAANNNGPDIDPEGDPLTLISVDGQAVPGSGLTFFTTLGLQIDVTSDGAATVSDPNHALDFLNDGEQATDSFTYVVSDPQGLTATTQFTAIIDGSNDAPIANDDQIFVAADQTIIFNPILGDGIIGLDVDPEGDLLAVVTIDGSQFSAGDTIMLSSGANVVANMDGTFEYFPSGAFDNLGPNQTAQDSFAYEIADEDGLRSSAQVFIEVAAPPFPPIASDDAVTTSEDGPTVFDLFADNGGGADQNFSAGDLLLTGLNGTSVADGASVTLASGAVLTINSAGSVIYDPGQVFNALSEGQIGTDSFLYTITDASGAQDVGEVTVSVTGVNDAPVAANDLFRTDERTALGGNLFIDNGAGPDRDIDGGFAITAINSNAALVGAQITLPSGALLTVNQDGSVSFDPNGAFFALNNGDQATETLTYTVSDDQGATSEATAVIRIDGVTDTILGTSGSDTIRGTENADDIDGLGGNDLITGLADNDTIKGGQGLDIIRGGAGNDHLIGGADKDRIFGESGDDLIEGGGGNDRLLGLSGADTVLGGAGNDLVGGGGGRDRVAGGDGDDRIRGGKDADTLLGGSGLDRLQGGKGNDLIFGQAGNDTLTGADGGDTMLGGVGSDRLLGRRGDDLLTGGNGADQFVFNLGDGNDTITDFTHGADRIRIGTGAEAFADLTISQVGDDVLIAFGNVTVLSRDDDANDFGASDFIL